MTTLALTCILLHIVVYYTLSDLGDYHLNINMQESYWAADTSGMSEVYGPLMKFIKGTVSESIASSAFTTP